MVYSSRRNVEIAINGRIGAIVFVAIHEAFLAVVCENNLLYQSWPLNHMSRPSVWATKVAALIKGNNSQAALAQIKVAPTVKDLQQLRALMTADGSLLKHRLIDEATRDQIVALSAPRLHRSP